MSQINAVSPPTGSDSDNRSSSEARGDTDSTRWFAEQVQPHEPLLRAYVRRMVASVADVDDLIQDCYVRILRARESAPIRSSKAFLFTVARNAVRDLHRRRAVTAPMNITETESLTILDDKPGVAELVSRQQELALLAEAIHTLPVRCRQVFLLRKIQELAQKEIAARLGISENTVETLVAKGAFRCAEYLRRRGIG